MVFFTVPELLTSNQSPIQLNECICLEFRWLSITPQKNAQALLPYIKTPFHILPLFPNQKGSLGSSKASLKMLTRTSTFFTLLLLVFPLLTSASVIALREKSSEEGGGGEGGGNNHGHGYDGSVEIRCSQTSQIPSTSTLLHYSSDNNTPSIVFISIYSLIKLFSFVI